MKNPIKLLILAILIVFPGLGFAQSETNHSAKYIFLFIGDGMGLAHVSAAEAYLDATDVGRDMTFTGFPETGFVSTYALNRFITGSAAAGTALATGNKTNIGRISMDPEGNKAYETIAEKAKKHGRKVGIISSVSIDHATPAVFYAHQPSRNMYFEISVDLAASNFDFFGGGGFKNPNGNLDGMDVNAIDLAKENGFTYVNTFEALQALSKDNGKVIAVSPLLDESAAMPYEIDRKEGDPSLADFTEKAIELLENEDGFFIMVEGGKIDWASHANDPATVIHDVIAFDNAVSEAYEFYQENPDETLIIVTADHETGGMSLGNRFSGYDGDISLLQYQQGSFDAFRSSIKDFESSISSNPEAAFDRLMPVITDFYGLGNPDKIDLTENDLDLIGKVFKRVYYQEDDGADLGSYGDYHPLRITLTNILSQKSGIGWTTFSHTAADVPVWSIGPGSEQFTGSIDNTAVAKIIESVMN